MLIGVDVGGTFTDAVLVENGTIRATAKVSTGGDILNSVLGALDVVMKGVPAGEVKRLVFSTTIITNLIAEKKYDRVGLLLIPGPGLNHDMYRYETDTRIINGAIDYRGREFIPLDREAVEMAVEDFTRLGYTKIAVVGKFSNRNSKHEDESQEIITSLHPRWHVEKGHLSGGQLNFTRRVVTTYYNCATRDAYHHFVDAVKNALNERKIKAEVYILKADGGAIPLEASQRMPVETIFSGPAASTLGVQALAPPGETSIVVDIGGTTTDLALILDGIPLMASKGAKIEDQYSHVRSLAVKTVPVGGDSVVERVGREFIVYSERVGQAYCLGGPMPTPTDALRVLGLTKIGDEAKAREAMHRLGGAIGMNSMEVAERVVEMVVDIITNSIEDMFQEWEQEPAYRVWEVLQKRKVRPQNVVGVGGGAQGFIEKIAAKLGCRPVLPPYAPVANAVGTAVARPTLQVTLRADTEQGIFTIQEEGFKGRLDKNNYDGEKLLRLAEQWLVKRAERMGLKEHLGEIEVLRREVFNMVRGFVTVGRLYTIVLQNERGIYVYIDRKDEGA